MRNNFGRGDDDLPVYPQMVGICSCVAGQLKSLDISTEGAFPSAFNSKVPPEVDLRRPHAFDFPLPIPDNTIVDRTHCMRSSPFDLAAMATYGKKRKGFLSSFSVFQDDKLDQDPNQQRSSQISTLHTPATLTNDPLAYARLGNMKTAMSRSRSRAKLGDENSDDDLTNGQPKPSSLHDHNVEALLLKSRKPNRTTTESSDKPLPSIPDKDSPPSEEQLTQARPALGAKTTNTRVRGNGRLTKADISAPILQGTTSTATGNTSRPATSGTTAQSSPGPKTSMAEADDLSQKISDLMMQAASQEEETKKRAQVYAGQPAKLSPFQRSKKALVKATRAVKDRLSSHSNDVPPESKLVSPSQTRLNYDSDVSPSHQTEEAESRVRLSRRIAEGHNLGNPKIRALMGDGKVPRKPLPVYESMKSRSLRSGSPDDPFSDGNEDQATPPFQDYSGFDFSFNKHTHEKKAASDLIPAVKDPILVRDQVNEIPGLSQQRLAVPQTTSRFSNMISGLAQHPDVMAFSSSPVGSSTPRVRLEPQSSAGPNRPAGALARSPSIIDFSFEARSEDGHSLAPSTTSKSITDGTPSVKRKSAHSDLRSPDLPLNKKSKLALTPSKDEARPAIETGQIDSEDERAPLSFKDKNLMLAPHRPASKGRGLNIFDLGKGKAVESKVDDVKKKERPKPIIGKRSSLQRPSGMLFRGRESRAGMKRLTNFDADSMDIDELQLDNSAYQVGGKK